MGLMDRLRKAERQGRERARGAFEQAKERGADLERRLRQRMRVYPRQATMPSEVSQSQPAGGVSAGAKQDVDAARHLEAEPEPPIVSIHGKDVGMQPALPRTEDQCEKEESSEEDTRRIA